MAAFTPHGNDNEMRTLLLPNDPIINTEASVIGPTDGLPWYQRAFVIFRPGWYAYIKQFATMQEISGAFGDLGLFLPLLTALAVGRVDGSPQIEFGPALFFTGVFTASLSLHFNIPIPVQPMKTIAAVAIAEKIANAEILAAGISMGVLMLVLAVTNFITQVAKVVPVAVIRGIQLGVGLNVVKSGFLDAYVKELTLTPATKISQFTVQSQTELVWVGLDSISVSLILGGLCVAFLRNPKVPMALLLFVYGLLVALYQYYTLKDKYHLPSIQFGPDFIRPVVPSLSDFQQAFTRLVLPQLPLTLLNSVIALEQLAVDLFPKHDAPASVRRVAYSIAGGNLILPWFGMLPVCHGAGGLASQYAFGARSSLAMAILGMCKIGVALLLGSSCVTLLQKGIFPQSVLGVMLIFSGVNFAAVGLKIDTGNPEDALLLLLTAGGCLGINTGGGFLVGFATHLLLRLVHYLRGE